jgi:hypothetical protein
MPARRFDNRHAAFMPTFQNTAMDFVVAVCTNSEPGPEYFIPWHRQWCRWDFTKTQLGNGKPMGKFTLVKAILALLVALPILAIAHYFTPGVDVVRITGINTIRVDTDRDPNNNNQPGQTRDVYEIFAESFDKKHIYVYENEDNWWYLKFDSADVQSRANAIATARDDKDRVAAVTNIGWRIPVLSMFPNALSVKSVDPSYSPFPSLALIIWGFIVLVAALVWLMFRRWRSRRLQIRDARRAAEEAAILHAERKKIETKEDVTRRFIDE